MEAKICWFFKFWFNHFILNLVLILHACSVVFQVKRKKFETNCCSFFKLNEIRALVIIWIIIRMISWCKLGPRYRYSRSTSNRSVRIFRSCKKYISDKFNIEQKNMKRTIIVISIVYIAWSDLALTCWHFNFKSTSWNRIVTMEMKIKFVSFRDNWAW